MSFTRLLSATVSPPNITRTRRGESSKKSTWSLGGRTSKLNVLSPWSPNGPVPIVRVIAPFLLSAAAPQEQLAGPHLPALIVQAHHGSGDPLRITQLGVVEISEDNAASADDHSKYRALSISTVHP